MTQLLLDPEPPTEVQIEYEPFEKQQIAHQAVEKFVLYGGAMGGGKTVWIANEGIQLSIEFPGNVGYLARHEFSSFRRTTLVELMRYLPRELIKSHRSADQRIELVNGSVIWYGGLRSTQAEKPLDRLKSMTLGWFGIDEASETDEQYFRLLISRLRLTLPNGKRPRYKGLLASNPEPGWLYRRFIVKQHPNHVFVPALPTDNPHNGPEYYQMLHDNFTEEERDKYLHGKWSDLEGGSLVFPEGAIELCLRTKKRLKGGRRELGVDVARKGKNWTVVAERLGNRVKFLEEYRRRSTAFTTSLLRQMIKEKKPDVCNIDAVGLGAGVYDSLAALGLPVNEVVAGSPAMDKKRFVNFRAEMYWYVRKLLIKGKIRLPEHERFLDQLRMIKYKIQSDKKIKIESKEDMEKRGMESPDHVDAFINTFVGRKSKVQLHMV